jgi:hypothetical protein
VFSYNDAFARLHPALRRWRAARAGGGPAAAPVHIVSADVSRAFDRVDAGKLLEIVALLLGSQEYLIVKHVEVQRAPQFCHCTCFLQCM